MFMPCISAYSYSTCLSAFIHCWAGLHSETDSCLAKAFRKGKTLPSSHFQIRELFLANSVFMGMSAWDCVGWLHHVEHLRPPGACGVGYVEHVRPVV